MKRRIKIRITELEVYYTRDYLVQYDQEGSFLKLFFDMNDDLTGQNVRVTYKLPSGTSFFTDDVLTSNEMEIGIPTSATQEVGKILLEIHVVDVDNKTTANRLVELYVKQSLSPGAGPDPSTPSWNNLVKKAGDTMLGDLNTDPGATFRVEGLEVYHPGNKQPINWGELGGNIANQTDLISLLNLKANVGDSYLKGEIDTKFQSYYTKTQIDAQFQSYYTKTEVYDKTEIDTSLGLKQNKTDNLLETTDKTIVGAINEVNTKIPVLGVNHYCIVNALGTGAENEIIDANLPANINLNSRYVLTNPFGVGKAVIVKVEIKISGKWADPGWFINTGAFGVNGGFSQGEGIIIQTGSSGVYTDPDVSGALHGINTTTTSAECRVHVWRVETKTI